MVVIPRNSHQSAWDVPDQASSAEAWAHRSNRRRLRVFLGLFLLTLLPGLAWNFLRPATYRATARLQIKGGSIATSVEARAPTKSGTRADPGDEAAESRSVATIDLLTQIQVLTSRPLLESAHRHLQADGYQPGDKTSDPISMLQNMLSVAPIPGTNIVEVEAIGTSPPLLRVPVLFVLILAVCKSNRSTTGFFEWLSPQESALSWSRLPSLTFDTITR